MAWAAIRINTSARMKMGAYCHQSIFLASSISGGLGSV